MELVVLQPGISLSITGLEEAFKYLATGNMKASRRFQPAVLIVDDVLASLAGKLMDGSTQSTVVSVPNLGEDIWVLSDRYTAVVSCT